MSVNGVNYDVNNYQTSTAATAKTTTSKAADASAANTKAAAQESEAVVYEKAGPVRRCRDGGRTSTCFQRGFQLSL